MDLLSKRVGLDYGLFYLGLILGYLPFTAQAQPSSGAVGAAEYFSYVNWEYSRRNDLVGWINTSLLIQESLRDWGYDLRPESVENTGVNQLSNFQGMINQRRVPGLKLIYLASHQTPSGRLDFPDREHAFWSEGFSSHQKSSGSPTVLLLDVCHADIIPQVRMQGLIPFHFLLSAAAPEEETYELRMFSRRPVDFKRRFPEEVEWMQQKLGPDWKGQVSFLGFCWVRQYLRFPHAPRNEAEWQKFLEGMALEAKTFARERSRYLSSTLKLWK